MYFITALAAFGFVAFGVWFVFTLVAPDPSSATAEPQQSPRNSDGSSWILCGALVLAVLAMTTGLPTIHGRGLNPHSMFEETRAGVTRSELRDHLTQMESHVPNVLHDMESRLPGVTADMEREMMRSASQYGISHDEIRSQLRAMESESRRQIRGMDGDMRRQIRDMEQPIWNELHRIEWGY